MTDKEKIEILTEKLLEYEHRAIFPEFPQDTVVVGKYKGEKGRTEQVLGYYISPWRQKHVLITLEDKIMVVDSVALIREKRGRKRTRDM